MAEKEHCSHCGQSIMKHKHGFSKALADMLLLAAEHYLPGVPFHLQKDLELTKNQYANFQQLKYWELIKKFYDKDGKRASGYWAITELGEKVVRGGSVPKWVQVYNNKVIHRSLELISVRDAIGYYDLPIAWAHRAEPMEIEQLNLF